MAFSSVRIDSMWLNIFLGAAISMSEVKTGITYHTVGETALQADFYPAKQVGPTPAPFVIVIHGGGWIGGQRSEMSALCQQMSQAGLASATVSYRLGPKHKWPAMIEDVQAAVRYFRSNAKEYGIDPNRFGASGGSAGGHLALLLGFRDTWDPKTSFLPDQSSRVKAVFNIFGPTDLRKDFDRTVAGFVSMQVIGNAYDPESPDAAAFSPVSYVSKDSAPVFTLHGKVDKLVPVMQAQRLDEALKAAGVKHEMRLIEGMDHSVDVSNPEVVKAVTDGIKFLVDQLGHTAGSRG